MDYSRKNHYLKFKSIDDDWVYIEDFLTGETWEVRREIADFLRALNGKTDPYNINEEFSQEFVDELLDDFDEEGWLYSGQRLMSGGIGTALFTLWIPDVKIWHRIVAKIWNSLLMLLCLPVFIIGVSILVRGDFPHVDHDTNLGLCYLVGLVPGLMLHELSHAAACLSDVRGNVFEFGIMIRYFLPGAYVVLDSEKIRNRFKKAQIFAAGIEMNLLLAGIFLILLKFGWLDCTLLIYAALLNGILAAFNLALIGPLDGMKIFSELLGVENIVDKAKKLIFDNEAKKILRKRGINGRAAIASCYIIVGFQLLLPLVLILNVISIMGLFN